MTTLINTGTSPVVYTRDGRTIGAGERMEDVELDEVGRNAVECGRLTEREPERKRRSKTADKSTVVAGGELPSPREEGE